MLMIVQQNSFRFKLAHFLNPPELLFYSLVNRYPSCSQRIPCHCVPSRGAFTGMLQPDLEGGHFFPSTVKLRVRRTLRELSHTSLRGVQLDTMKNVSLSVSSSAMHVFRLICHGFFNKTLLN